MYKQFLLIYRYLITRLQGFVEMLSISLIHALQLVVMRLHRALLRLPGGINGYQLL